MQRFVVPSTQCCVPVVEIGEDEQRLKAQKLAAKQKEGEEVSDFYNSLFEDDTSSQESSSPGNNMVPYNDSTVIPEDSLFCTLCNQILSSSTPTSQHLVSPIHIFNRDVEMNKQKQLQLGQLSPPSPNSSATPVDSSVLQSSFQSPSSYLNSTPVNTTTTATTSSSSFVGSSDHSVTPNSLPTFSSIENPIISLPRDSIGYKLIMKEGWKEGQGLGKFNQGPVVPFIPRYKNDRLGIGLVSKLHHFFKQPLHIRQQLLQQQRTGTPDNESLHKQKKQEDLEQQKAMQELERVLRQFKPENFALQCKLNQVTFNATGARSSSNQASDFFSVLDELSRVSEKFDSAKREQAAANAANQTPEVPVYRIVDSVNGPVTVSTTLKPSSSSASTSSKTPLIYTKKQKKLVTERDKLKAQLIRQEIYGR